SSTEITSHMAPSASSFSLPIQAIRPPSSSAAPISPRRSLRLPNTPSFYEVLGVETTSSTKEIKSAYRGLARVLHPDAAFCSAAEDAGRGASSTADEFIRLRTAYSTLSDPEKRAAYDVSLLRRGNRTVSLSSGEYSGAARGRRNWETDQCW
ncbi:hypothetical protein M569_00628, partial [Genlisea aurea]